ncbi:MAG TPA: hypothetical protein DCP53_00430 [Elusimicrobia bacterium]|nr:MAG: hypothetical protein A2551_04760 [Elusimicrobia bacterium RIFOXYD2_FULL_34_30]HAM37857.1 hypothetical protein [Elusimicrobiota bacterium]
MNKISIVIPAYNEEYNIEYVVNEAIEVLKNATDCPEIIIVDDGSNDSTGKKLNKLKEKFNYLKIIQHSYNKGVGESIVDGFMAASGDLIFFNSADRQAPMSYLLEMLPMINNYDLVVAGYYNRKDSFIRILFSRCYHFLIRILFNIKLHNVNAMKLLKKEVFNKNIKWGKNLCIDTEIVVRAKKKNYKIGEVTLEHYPRVKGETKVVNVKNALVTFINLFILYFKLQKENLN